MNSTNSIKGYLNEEGRFTQFPGKRQKAKQAEILEILAGKFEQGRKYTETEVNDILNQYHTFNDPATLRRLMFGKGLLGRTLDGREYWRIKCS